MKQRDQYSCGPVALANIKKWAGSGGSIKNWHKHFIKMCNCTPKRGGTSIWDLEEALETIDEISFQRIEQPNLNDIDRHLDADGIILLRVRSEERRRRRQERLEVQRRFNLEREIARKQRELDELKKGYGA